MSRFGLILLIPIILSCSMLERKNDIVYSSKHIHTDSSKIIPPDYLAVLMSRELTEKTTFVIDGNVWESMLINKDSKFQRHLFNALSCKDKENYTGVIYEPWHYRYVGKDHAKKMNQLNMCLEEYVEYLQKNS